MNKRWSEKFSDWLKTTIDDLIELWRTANSSVGKFAFRALDVLAGGLTLSWVVNQYAPESFRLLGYAMVWTASVVAFYFVIWIVEVGEKKREKKKWWFWLYYILAWVINIADSLVDASAIFVVFGITEIFSFTLDGLWQAVEKMPILGWFPWFIVFTASLLAEMFPTGDEKDNPFEGFVFDDDEVDDDEVMERNNSIPPHKRSELNPRWKLQKN